MRWEEIVSSPCKAGRRLIKILLECFHILPLCMWKEQMEAANLVCMLRLHISFHYQINRTYTSEELLKVTRKERSCTPVQCPSGKFNVNHFLSQSKFNRFLNPTALSYFVSLLIRTHITDADTYALKDREICHDIPLTHGMRVSSLDAMLCSSHFIASEQ